MGYDITQTQNWDNMKQPLKPDLLKLFKNIVTNYENTNVKIQIDETIFNCHMIVLQCYSDYFKDKTLEQIIELPSAEVSLRAFIMIYDWMLSNEPMVQREGLLELFHAAKFLRIKDLVYQCWTCIENEERFSEDSAFLFFLEARQFGYDSLKYLMLTKIFKFFLPIVASKEFLTLSHDEVISLLNSHSIGVKSEMDILLSAVRWLNFDWDKRNEYMLDIIKCVRFGLMAPWQLIEFFSDSCPPEIRKIVENSEVRKMVENGISYVTTKYYHGTNIEKFSQQMIKLKLVEPIERHWILDDNQNFDKNLPENHIENSYKEFLKYLDKLRNPDSNHWKNWKSYKENLNKTCDLQGGATTVSDITRISTLNNIISNSRKS